MPEFYWSVKPWKENQGWGTYNPAVYQKFGFTRHNGLDVAPPPTGPFNIYAPCDGDMIRRGYQPNGGGIFIGMVTKEYDFGAFQCTTPEGNVVDFGAMKAKVLIDFLHLKQVLVNDGQHVRAGQLIAIGDNTGDSTGEHCHEQYRRVSYDGIKFLTLDSNEANNSFDPTQFFNGKFAQDHYEFTFDLSFGMHGSAVAELQKRLGLSPTGNFLYLTKAAVQGYQVAHGIANTGYVGPKTRASLNGDN